MKTAIIYEVKVTTRYFNSKSVEIINPTEKEKLLTVLAGGYSKTIVDEIVKATVQVKNKKHMDEVFYSLCEKMKLDASNHWIKFETPALLWIMKRPKKNKVK